jgi:lipid II:glycine glycyltransferase (peptidoglycan interpeptide bridge formation enzyme)
MVVHEVNNREVWNGFVHDHAPRSGAFLQTWEWGEFQRAAGYRVRRVIGADDRGPAAAAQLVEHRLPFGMRYQYCPRGPVARLDAPGASLDVLSAVARRTRSLFVRFEPAAYVRHTGSSVRSTTSLSPASTLVTDLTLSFDDLSRNLHPKTRYNVGLAERKGVTVELRAGNFDEVWGLFETTATRGQFRLHPRAYYERMLGSLSTDTCRAFLAVARVESKIIAANVMIDCQGTRTYLHGASANEHRDAMAPYLLHWELLKDAKREGLRLYDWWGVAPEGAGESHPWAGITRFKQGFGGARLDYAGTFDLITRPTLYRVYEWIRALRRKV